MLGRDLDLVGGDPEQRLTVDDEPRHAPILGVTVRNPAVRACLRTTSTTASHLSLRSGTSMSCTGGDRQGHCPTEGKHSPKPEHGDRGGVICDAPGRCS